MFCLHLFCQFAFLNEKLNLKCYESLAIFVWLQKNLLNLVTIFICRLFLIHICTLWLCFKHCNHCFCCHTGLLPWPLCWPFPRSYNWWAVVTNCDRYWDCYVRLLYFSLVFFFQGKEILVNFQVVFKPPMDKEGI